MDNRAATQMVQQPFLSCLTVDVEDWYHILDSPASPPIEEWESLECRVERNLERILELLAETGARATFFWLGWVAARHRELVCRCQAAGHEVGSHGYGHVLAHQVGAAAFRRDVERAKAVLEDIVSGPVPGFRAPGFGVTARSVWALDVIRGAGHDYDASVFPAPHGHGGMANAPLGPHVIPTRAGPLAECPMSVVETLGGQFCLFSGGYMRLAPTWLIRRGIERLRSQARPLITLVHPREIDPGHPRLPLTARRRFKSYVGLRGMFDKLKWLCEGYKLRTMGEVLQRLALSEHTDFAWREESVASAHPAIGRVKAGVFAPKGDWR